MINRPMYVDRIMAYKETPFIKILTGIRRCGKSTILKLIMKKLIDEYGVSKEQIADYRFDSMEYDDFTAKQMYLELKGRIVNGKKTYFFLDEIQEIDGWEKVINSISSDYDVDIYVTGSNSRMMSSEISTYLTGRYVTFHIYTLSFEEYLTFTSKYRELKGVREEFAEYVKLGGFPATHLKEYTQDEIYTVVRDIYNSTVFSDIVKRNTIRKVDQLERVIKYAFQNVGNTFSAKTICDYMKSEHRRIDNETVYSYLKNLEKSYLIHRCSRYDIKGRALLKTQEKFYVADVSLRYSILGYNVDDVASSLENIVYLELCRRGYEVSIGKTLNGEVDFIAIKQNNKIYVQVTQKINSEKTEKREYERLLEIDDNYPKYVLLTNDFTGGNYEGIKTMHIADFLISQEW